jgi:tetratricopeptide (TPR) repeat protein
MTWARGSLRTICGLAVLAFLIRPVPVRAQAADLLTAAAPGSRVLVMPFTVEADRAAASAETAWLGEAAAILISEELDKLGLETLPRDERVAAFDRLQLPLLAPLTRATTIRVGDVLGASDIVVGEIQAGDPLVVRARLIRLDVGQQLADVEARGSAAELEPIFDRVAVALAGKSGRPHTPEPAPRPPMPPDVFENYVKGLMAVSPATRQRFLEAAYHGARRDGRVLLALWSAYTDQAQHAKALAAAKTVAADSPWARDARFAAALSLIELSRLSEAYKTLSDLDKEQPAPALASALGVVQLRLGARSEGPAAVSYFTRAVEAAPEHADYLFNLGYVYALAHNAASALLWLREDVRVDATDGDAHFLMSALLASTGKTVEAQRELDLARLLGTARQLPAGVTRDRIPTGWERLPQTLDTSATRVISIRNPAQREQQEVAAFHLAEGRRLYAAQQDREAIDELRRSVYLSPYQDEPHLLLGRLYVRAGRLSDAIDEFKVAIWSRESFEARLELGHAYLAAGDKPAARREADRALVLQPGAADAEALREKAK